MSEVGLLEATACGISRLKYLLWNPENVAEAESEQGWSCCLLCAHHSELKRRCSPPCPVISFDEVVGTERGWPWVVSRRPGVAFACHGRVGSSAFTDDEAETKTAGRQRSISEGHWGFMGRIPTNPQSVSDPQRNGPLVKFCLMFST